MRNVIVAFAIHVIIIQLGLDALDILCRTTPHICYIDNVPQSIASNATYNFRLNETVQSIWKVEFVPNDNVSLVMETVPNEMFSTFPQLQTLFMTTHINELHSDGFAHAFKLIELFLNGNRLTAIRDNVFSMAARRAQGAQLSIKVPEMVFESVYPLHKLRRLELRHNEIAEIVDNSFDGLTTLHILDLAHNQLTGLRSRTFTGLVTLAFLDVSNNRISSIEENALLLPKLEQLHLQHNRLKQLSNGIFQHSPMLISIYLNDNELELIGDAFNGLANIGIISLSRNRIQDIDLVPFASFPHLHILELAHSGLTFETTEIKNEVEHWKSPLEVLDISDNNLTDSTEWTKLEIFPHLTAIHLDDNPITNGEFLANLSFSHHLNEIHLYRTNVECEDAKLIPTIVERPRIIIKQDC